MASVLMDAEDMRRTLRRMANEILEANHGTENLVVGERRGETCLQMLRLKIASRAGRPNEVRRDLAGISVFRVPE